MDALLVLLPILAVGTFFIMPWPYALVVCVVLVVGSVLLHRKAMEPQHNTPVIGKRAMIGSRAVVVSVQGTEAEVDYQGEMWRATSAKPLRQGQQVVIEDIVGLVLKVAPDDERTGQPEGYRSHAQEVL